MAMLCFLLVTELVGLIPIILIWQKDCKEIGKENLAVNLKDRIVAYVLCFVIPSVLGILIKLQ